MSDMKRVALEKSIYGRFEDQGLIKDYHELEKETKAAKDKLAVMNQRKLTLLTEVRFMRKRRKYLLDMKAANPREMQMVLQNRHKSSAKEKNRSKNETNLQSKSPIWNRNMKEMSSTPKKSALKTKEFHFSWTEKKNIGKEVSIGNKNLVVNLDQKERMNGAKVGTFKHPSDVLSLKVKERFYVGKETDLQLQKNNLGLDLNEMDRSRGVREESVQNQAPVFDLNLKVGEEDDLQESYETSISEEPESIFVDGNKEQQLNDVNLSICRNVENVPNNSGKRKISWQDPVALSV